MMNKRNAASDLESERWEVMRVRWEHLEEQEGIAQAVLQGRKCDYESELPELTTQ